MPLAHMTTGVNGEVAGAVGSGSLTRTCRLAPVFASAWRVEPAGYRVHGVHGPLYSAGALVTSPSPASRRGAEAQLIAWSMVGPAAVRTAGNPIGICPGLTAAPARAPGGSAVASDRRPCTVGPTAPRGGYVPL